MVNEVNPIELAAHHRPEPGARRLDWADPELAKITRLRLLTDPGFPMFDVSYCWGRTRDGERVNVALPFDQLPRKGLNRAIVAHAKQDRVFAKGLGLFDALSILF